MKKNFPTGIALTSLFIFCCLLDCNALFGKPILKKYDLTFSFDFINKRLFCKASLQLDQIKPNDTLHLLLYRLLKIRTVRDENGNSIPFDQRVTAFSDWELLQVNHITVLVGKIKPLKATTSMIIEYEGALRGYTETGMQYVKDNISPDFTILRMDAYAYPVQAEPSLMKNNANGLSYFDYTVSVTVPDSLAVINGGKLINKVHRDQSVEYVYQNLKPAWRIDIAISKYATLNDEKFAIHYFPEDSLGAKNLSHFLKKAYALYRSWFGEVDFSGYAIIEIPDYWGSQTDVTCILQTASAFKDEKRLYELYHEISHIWNITSTDSRPCRLESEGLAVFLQYLVTEKLHHQAGIVDSVAEKTFQRLKRRFTIDSTAANTPVIEYGKKQMTDLSYTKGMLFFYILYKRVGEAALMDALRNFYTLYKAKGATIDDFSNCLVTTLKDERIEPLINDWIRTNKSAQDILIRSSVKELLK